MAENLGVHEIAEAYETADEGYGNDEPVEGPKRIALGGDERIEQYADDNAYRAAVAGEATVPYVEDGDGICL